MTTTPKPTLLNCPTCDARKTKAWHLVCGACWGAMPEQLREELVASHAESVGSPRHQKAVHQAFECLSEHRELETMEPGSPVYRNAAHRTPPQAVTVDDGVIERMCIAHDAKDYWDCRLGPEKETLRKRMRAALAAHDAKENK